MDRKITMLSLFKFIQSDKGYVISILVCTLICELSTCVGRFGFKISLKENEQVIKKLTLGIRIHHGYVGIGMILSAVMANAYVSSNSPLLRFPFHTGKTRSEYMNETWILG